MSGIREKLRGLNIELPAQKPALGNYVDVCITGSYAFVSGKLPLKEDGGLLYSGRLGREVTIEQGYEAAALCARHILACLEAALGDLDRVKQIVRLGGFVAAAEGFTDIPKVINGASDLFVTIFGATGRHARAAVGVASLPLGVPVEVEALVEIVP
jgi:enamine deaminase RidA (YjgF/YER057c/UK114 family)